VKKRKKEEKKEEEVVVEAPPPEEKKKRKKKSTKKKSYSVKYSGALSMFNEKQLREFKDGFNFMDQDKDGIITKADLFRVFDIVGTRASDAECDQMLGEAPNPITFTQMLTLFAERMQGKVDDDELIIDSFKAYDDGEGKCGVDEFKGIMMGKGDSLSAKECTEIFTELPRVEDKPDFISIKGVIGMLVSPKNEEEAPAPAAEAPAAEA